MYAQTLCGASTTNEFLEETKLMSKQAQKALRIKKILKKDYRINFAKGGLFAE